MAILGYNTQGATTRGFAAGRLWTSKFTLAAAATMTELHGWFGVGTGGSTFRIVIYADDGSGTKPGARVAYTSTMTSLVADTEFSEAGFSIPLAAGIYWIGFYSPGTGAAVYKDTGAASSCQAISTGASDPPPNPFGTPTFTTTDMVSCWAVVGAAAAAFVPQIVIA